MGYQIGRREFLTVAVAGTSLPQFLTAVPKDGQEATETLRLTEDRSGLWDYRARPVGVTNPALPDTRGEAWHYSAKFAFDGYGGSQQPNAVAHAWVQEGKPSDANPFFCTIDYGTPVAVTKFLHYFYAPGVKDYRPDPLVLSSAWQSVKIYRSADGAAWILAEQINELPPDLPQALTLSEPREARYYKLEITGVVDGANGLRTYEVETFTGPVIHNPGVESSEIKLGEICNVCGRVVGTEEPGQFTLSAAPSQEAEPTVSLARVETGGWFNLGIRPVRAGTVPLMLELRNKSNAVVDRRKLNLHVAPRVVISAVRVEGEALTGRLSNSAAASIAVTLQSGTDSRFRTKLAPGTTSDFRLKGSVHGGIQTTEVSVEEGNGSSSNWVFAVERPETVREGTFQSGKIKVEWSLEAQRIGLRLTLRGAGQAIQAALYITLDDVPMSFSVSRSDADTVAFLGRHDERLLKCTLRATDSSVSANFRILREGLQHETASGAIGLRLKADGVKFRFVPAYVYSTEPITSLKGLYGKEPLSTIRGGCAAPTRMVALETTTGTLALVLTGTGA